MTLSMAQDMRSPCHVASAYRLYCTPGGRPCASRPPEPSNWHRHGPHLRMLAVAIVLTVAAASAGMLMALMGD